ncbi:MAG: tetratricopeptide repeat protein [Flavimaricola sp.]|nr:tetratricopeptide repeat protein [Flavimaricola sp.]
MILRTFHFKCIVAALLLSWGISTPVLADQARIDDLLSQLKEAEPGMAERIATEIQTEWSKSGSPAMDLLLRRGQDALEAGDPGLAAEHLTATIDHAPDFAEAYSARANAYYRLGLVGPAIEDLRVALILNPQNFYALRGFGVLLDEMGRTEDALAIFRQVHDIYPSDPGTAEAIDRLERMLEGQAL